MPFCQGCGAEVVAAQGFCGACGQGLGERPTAAERPAAVNTGRLLALLGALAIVVAAVIPWMTMPSAIGNVSISGLEYGGWATCALGLFLVFVVLVSRGQSGARYSPIGAALGLVVALIALWHIVDILRPGLINDLIPASPGAGLYVTAAGGLLAMVGSLQRTP